MDLGCELGSGRLVGGPRKGTQDYWMDSLGVAGAASRGPATRWPEGRMASEAARPDQKPS